MVAGKGEVQVYFWHAATRRIAVLLIGFHKYIAPT